MIIKNWMIKFGKCQTRRNSGSDSKFLKTKTKTSRKNHETSLLKSSENAHEMTIKFMRDEKSKNLVRQI